ncbi:hypothetical protein LTR56_015302 [Elasticomyces elasticus]|nr:hypothetical protein LTR56_015302 [Elasticomyces elasticus]KAK3640400.1 hypothetical protein LTR22_017057 [Elasticomyces elasticus]KAK4913650.1 hypothetical protein LTR49_018064 [Elasticomyces elasticus]KAK5753077.1 hypothetical protein LTS12_016857 [Elasticomyces elasticus]
MLTSTLTKHVEKHVLHLEKTEGGYGPGSWVDTDFIPVPKECERLLALMALETPGFTKDYRLLQSVTFEGDDLPNIPGPIKAQAFTSVLHAMAGIIGHEILAIKGLSTDQKTTINTDMGGLFPANPALVTVDGVNGPAVLQLPTVPHLRPPPGLGKDADYDHFLLGNALKLRSQAIYPTATKDTWFQLHGSTDPYAALQAMNIDADMDAHMSKDAAYDFIKAHTLKYQARELELIFIEQNVPSSIVYSPKGWNDTIMGKSLAKHPLVNYKKCKEGAPVPPAAFPEKLDKRPLAGIKVVELARIIALPATGIVLSSMGAEVVRVQCRDLPDFSPAQLCLTQGKKTTHLDLDNELDKAALRALIEDADVILQGYRSGAMDRRGFGLDYALEVANKRGKGICYLDENCYGPDGVYHERRGWQQVADAASGCEYVMGLALGYPEGQGILPSLPISDMSTGVLGAVTTMSMLRDRARFGGSYHGAVSLTAYNCATLTKDFGLYQPEIVQKIQDKYQFKKITSDIHVIELYYDIAQAWKENSNLIADEKYYTHFGDSVYGKDLRILRPLIEYTDAETTPRWTSPPVPFCYHADVTW